MARQYRISDTDLRDILPNAKYNPRTEHYVCDCVFCGKPGHMFVNRSTQMFDCKKCSENGGIYKILRHINRLDLLQGGTVELRTEISSIRQVLRAEEPAQEEEMPVVKLPVGFRVGEQVPGYLRYRGLSEHDIVYYKIGHTQLLQKFLNYLIIPIYDGGEVRGYIGRYASSQVPFGKLRYNNSRGTNFANLLYGYDEIVEETHTVILVEGAFDKYKLDRVLHLYLYPEIKCCATFGKKISARQIRKLTDKGIRNVILMFDKDAVKEMKHYGMELQKYFVTAIGVCAGKDVDASTDEQVCEAFWQLKSPADFNNSTMRTI